MIAQDVLNTILSASDIDEVINDFLKLQKKGVNYNGTCFFTMKKRLVWLFLQLRKSINVLVVV